MPSDFGKWLKQQSKFQTLLKPAKDLNLKLNNLQQSFLNTVPKLPSLNIAPWIFLPMVEKLFLKSKLLYLHMKATVGKLSENKSEKFLSKSIKEAQPLLFQLN